MARLVLIQFANNAEAEAYVASLRTGKSFVSAPQDDGDYKVVEVAPQVLGMYGRPTTFCVCEDTKYNQVRGAKLGWWVCAKCNKARPERDQIPANLLAGEDDTRSLDDKRPFVSIGTVQRVEWCEKHKNIPNP